jgi:flagellar M-ring protein FliF
LVHAGLIALGVIGVSVFAMTGLAGYFLSRPASEVLYAGLDRQDVGRMAGALKEADIPFDVSSDGGTVLVRYGETARARMLLAEKGLPNSPNAGNELYDKLGSLGLTSFMQEVTRVRALEGELARTIQLMRGIKAARVQIVLADEGSFRRVRQPPSASVVVRADTPDDIVAAKAIRHLVASAVPGMTPAEVTVLSTDGVQGSAALSKDDQGSHTRSGDCHERDAVAGADVGFICSGRRRCGAQADPCS